MGRDFSSRSILKSSENQKGYMTDAFVAIKESQTPPGFGIYS